MSAKLDILSDNLPEAAQTFLVTHRYAMLYHLPEWLRIVAALTSSELFYLVLSDGGTGHTKGIVPLCLKNGAFGVIANSSPFFGSHGGILAADDESFQGLARALHAFLIERRVMLMNVIEPLFECSKNQYERTLPVSAMDHRIGQFKDLGLISDRDTLLGSVGGLTRSNLNRKAWRSGMKIYRDESPAALESLYAMHVQEMGAKPGGNPKPRSFFEQIAHLRQGAVSYRLYLGEIDGEVVAGLLLLLWREYVEYITPVFKDHARASQPLSALVFQAMLDAVIEGYRWWNFGGTWREQENLMKFKESWGAQSKPYQYYVLDLGGLEAFKGCDREVLKKEYYGFYLYPF